jgi:hydroxypyruvate isomerase
LPFNGASRDQSTRASRIDRQGRKAYVCGRFSVESKEQAASFTEVSGIARAIRCYEKVRSMPKFCANLTMLYNEVDFIERFGAAAKSGFKGVEFLFPYAYPKEQLADELGKHKLTQVLHNLPAGDWAKGERGIACHPDRVNEFQDGVGKAIEYATVLGCKQVNCLAGIAPQGVPEDKLRATFVANLKFAAPKLAQAGIKLLVEPINTRDIPSFYLTRTKQALGILDEVGSSNLWVQYDIYHMQIMEGDLARGMQENLARIAHLQLADNPGRNEPGTGEINYPFLFDWIDRIGYQGWIGCEYKPKAETVAGLGWLKPYM